MQPQRPAQRIMQTDDFSDAKAYKVVCSCGHNAHEHNVWVEIEHDIKQISVTVYTHVSSKQGRWCNIWQLLTKGYVELETSLLMDKQQALNYAETLKTAIADLDAQTKTK